MLEHPSNGAIEQMARWVAGLTAGAVPQMVNDIARNCLIDTVGVMAAGSVTPVAERAFVLAQLSGATGVCRVIGRAASLDVRQACFVNGVAAHALDFDDNCYAGFVHGSAVIAPAAVAMAQHLDASGQDLLTAFVAGAECEYALGAASHNVLYDLGWWTTGVLGPVGSCAAAAWLLRMDWQRTASALGLAVAGAAGIKACFGTDAKPFLAGRASEAGVTAALMASIGASGPHDAFEHRNGFARLFNGGEFDATGFDALGQRWSLQQPGIDVKRIPVCLSSHAAVDAVAQLLQQHDIAIDDIARIVCDVPPIVIANLVHDDPVSPQQAQFSMPFAIAASLLYGTLELRHLNVATLDDQRLRTLMRKIGMTSSSAWDDPQVRADAPEGARVTLTLVDGTTLDGMRAHARGAAREPLGDGEIDRKFMACLANAGLAASSATWLAQWRALEHQASARALLA
ncbi:MmgE/PrpD family protein [Herbaspirillum sp. alder98]|uniref:MmgE/PrpD family protein n=1 Tax=Herbaspirillum sp. alder98 TaxID=2913096 RepID=UPI001CD88967|nr:MmgE/PrpD family protein [Herbaspirillum sp. alder98]MCA1323204.1 MmgE/PrpD family protein [Herbaspirillum sp. alder98]